MCFRFLLISIILLSTLSPGFCQENEEYLFPSQGDYPVLKKTGKQADDFVPRGWTVLAKAAGDLNDDRIEDCALVVKGESEKFKVRNFDKLGVDLFDTNPRILIILFGEKAGYKLATASKTIVPIPDTPLMEEPVSELVVKDGVLEFEVQETFNAGSWRISISRYKFRFEKGDFYLIGADTDEIHRGNGDQIEVSYNFLTGKAAVKLSNMSDDNEVAPQWKKIKPPYRKTIESLKKLYQWEAIPGYKL
ncbi:MAG: hypothetical protein KC777_20530 [Cyanobacteria bacterium HKST-UBA02]|nr:hypothetical protein [Cyanobacteria bacterium HKST-UBA02]